MTTTIKKIWRADITGLRALAVIPVLIFHAWPNLLPGGFVGVDVFFVISGYLISGILFKQLIKNNSINYFDFYGKRIRRIIPNLVLLLFFVATLGYFFLSYKEYIDLGRQIYSSAFFYQNFRLLSDLGNYFAEDSSRQPLLHLWSLAIEEQFYIVFPIVCSIIWKFTKSIKILGYFVAILIISSLSSCLLVSDQASRFYWPFTRFWELGVGIAWSYYEIFLKNGEVSFSSKVSNVFSVIGFSLIIISYFLLTELSFPNGAALCPTIGAVLFIAAGPKGVANRIFSMKVFTFIGLISYSLYLWHWPLLSYWNIINPQHSVLDNLWLIILSILIATLVYKYVETPFRLINIEYRKKSVIFLLTLLFSTVVIGQGIRITKGLPWRSNSVAGLISSIRDDWTFRSTLDRVKISGTEIKTNDITFNPEILFVGDSHMQQYAERTKILSEKFNKKIAFATCGGCFVSPHVFLDSDKSLTLNHNLMDFINKKSVKTVVFAQAWGGYKNSKNINSYFVDLQGNKKILNDVNFDEMIEIYAEYIREIAKTKKVFIILDAPWDTGSYDPIKRINRLNSTLTESDFISDFPKQKDWIEGNETVRKYLSDIATIIDPVDQFCPNHKCNLLRYKDDDHLRSSYVRDNATWIDQIFEDGDKK